MNVHVVVQSQAQTASPPTRRNTERAERPEQTEAAERPERAGPPVPEEIRAQVQEAIRTAREAANEARVAEEAANQVRIQNGLPVPVGPRGRREGITIQGPDGPQGFIPPEVVDISLGFFFMVAAMVIGWPLARAFGRRLERGGQAAAVSPAMTEQLQRIEQAVDAMSVEIERISESQRYLTKLQSGAL